MKTIEPYQISRHLHNFCRTFERDITKPQMGRLKELMHGVVRGKKAILSEIAKQNRKDKVVRKQVQQYSNMLQKLPLRQMMMRKFIGFKHKIQKDTAIYIDLVDITKKYHKSMECIGTTWNGSEEKPGNGYEIIDVSIKQTDTYTTILRHMYSTLEQNYQSAVCELTKVLNIMWTLWGEVRGTLFLDTAADNENEIKLLIDYETAFVIRMNANRKEKDRIIYDEHGEQNKMMDLWKKPQGVTVWIDAKKKKKKIVPLQWRKILWKYKKQYIPLWLVWCHREDDPSPAVFLTSRCIENEVAASNIYHQYFARGGEEAIFKCHKDKLGMEKVQLESFEKVKQFMLLYVLVDQLLSKLRLEATKKQSIPNLLIKDFLKNEQRKITKWSVIDWYNELYVSMERSSIAFRRRYPLPDATFQLSLPMKL